METLRPMVTVTMKYIHTLPFLTTDDISDIYSRLVVEAASLQVGLIELVYYIV